MKSDADTEPAPKPLWIRRSLHAQFKTKANMLGFRTIQAAANAMVENWLKTPFKKR